MLTRLQTPKSKFSTGDQTASYLRMCLLCLLCGPLSLSLQLSARAPAGGRPLPRGWAGGEPGSGPYVRLQPHSTLYFSSFPLSCFRLFGSLCYLPAICQLERNLEGLGPFLGSPHLPSQARRDPCPVMNTRKLSACSHETSQASSSPGASAPSRLHKSESSR